MIDPDHPGESAADLARSFDALMERKGDADPSAEASAANPPTVAAAASPPPLSRIVEALLFIGGVPLAPARACEAVRGLTPERLTEVIDELNRDYRRQGRPYRIHVGGTGYELVLLPRFRAVRERLLGSPREARLSPAALDVLSLVAYRQPATRQEIEALRGADCAGPLRQLVRLGLVAVQRGDAGRREVSYGTTARFLSLFQLRGLDDLPRTQDLQQM
jgi:segregation and condensation protein B